MRAVAMVFDLQNQWQVCCIRNSSADIVKALSRGASWAALRAMFSMPRAWMARALRMSKVVAGNSWLAKGIAMAKRLTRASASFTWANSAAKRLNCSLSWDSVVVSRLQIWSRRSGVLSPSARR